MRAGKGLDVWRRMCLWHYIPVGNASTYEVVDTVAEP